MEHKLNQQNDISLAPEKMSSTSNTLENSSTDQHSAIKSKILNAIDKMRKNKKRADLNVAVKEHRLTFQKFVIVLVLSNRRNNIKSF